MSISIAIGGQDGSERVVSTNLKTIEFAAAKAAYIVEKLRSFGQPAEAAPVCVRVYSGATVHLSMDVAAAA
jgi:hypothetical protein